jgi:hypothetical protein
MDATTNGGLSRVGNEPRRFTAPRTFKGYAAKRRRTGAHGADKHGNGEEKARSRFFSRSRGHSDDGCSAVFFGSNSTAPPRRLGEELTYVSAGHRRRRGSRGHPRKGSSSGGGGAARFSSSLFASSTVGIADFAGTGSLSSQLLDWRVPSLSAEQELLQQVFATAYIDACYRCLIAQDAATSFSPNETLQLVVDQWRADAFHESQDTLRRVVEQYHHDLLQVVKSVVDAEDAALLALAGETAGAEENGTGVPMNASMSSPATVSTFTSTSSDTSLYQAFTTVGQANIPAMIDSPAVQKAVLHYAMPALGRVLVYQGFFLCFWYSSTGEKLGKLEHRACRWVLEAHIPHVHVPLCYHFRYKGRGVTAMSLAPIGENLTTTTEQNPEVAALAQQLASVFSLQPYGSSPGQMHAFAATASTGGPHAAGTGASSSPTMPMYAAAASLAGEHDREGLSLSNMSFASVSTAASADGEAMPEIHFLPPSVQTHFGQDGRYYFLRNSQWFPPWLNSRQSCDAAVQRLSYVNPRLLAVCGVQVSCRACQRDAFTEENRAALDFMRYEVDVGIPRLLHDEQACFVQHVLRSRRRAAARRLSAQRTAHAAAAAEAARHSTRVHVGRLESEDRAAASSALAGSHEGSGGDTNGASSDSEWTEEEEEEEDGQAVAGGTGVKGHRGRSARLTRATTTAAHPFTTTSVVRRFVARGYPKNLLGALLLALLQYPAAPLHMVREVRREILFRGLKAFIRTRSYEARFGVEQLLSRLPHERQSGEDVAATFTDTLGQFSEWEEEGEEEDDNDDDDEEGEPIHVELQSAREKTFQAGNASSLLSGGGSGGGSPASSRRGNGDSRRLSVERGNYHHRHNNDIRVDSGGASNPLLHASAVTPPRHPHHENGNDVAPPLSFTQRWQRRAETLRPSQAAAVAASLGNGEDAAGVSRTGEGVWGRLWRRFSALRPRWLGGGRGEAGGGEDVAVGGATLSTAAGNVLPNSTVAEQPSPSPPASPPHRALRRGTEPRNPLAASPAAGKAGITSGAKTVKADGERNKGAGPHPRLTASSTCTSAASAPPLSTWIDFNVTTERVLAAFMQYNGTTRPSHVFCDSSRRLYELEELREKEQALVAAAAAGEASGVGEGQQPAGDLDAALRSLAAQRQSAESSLWSSADMLNRMYVEQILPFIYRKFRLSPRHVQVLHDPLSEEDRVCVYVRLLDALGVSIKGGEVYQPVPLVMDFTPPCVEVPGSAAEVSSASLAESPPCQENDAGNPLQRRGGATPPSSSFVPTATRPGGGGDDGGTRVRHGRRGGHHHSSPRALWPRSETDPGSSSPSREQTSGSGAAMRASGVVGSTSEAVPVAAPPRTPAFDMNERLAACNYPPDSNGDSFPTLSSSHHRHQTSYDGEGSIGNGLRVPVTELQYRIPSWLVWRAKGLVQCFLARFDALPRRRGLSSAHAVAHHGSPHRRHPFDFEAHAGSAQVAGLVPLLTLLYNAPLTAFAADPHRPPLPPWRRTAAHLLAQLRAVAVTPHLLWDALELYELVDVRMVMQEARADRSFAAAQPATSSLTPASSSVDEHGDADDGDDDADDNDSVATVDVDGGERDGEVSVGVGSLNNGRRGASTTPSTTATTSTSLPPATDGGLPAPCCALALALLLRRRTLRSTSDRAILIQILRRYVAAIRDFPEVLCSLAPLHGSDDRATAELTAAVEEQAGWVGGRLAQTAGVESAAVYTAVLSTLQEVLLNADLLLDHFSNPFAAQYRQYTADLVGYLEYNMNTLAAALPGSASGAYNSSSSGSGGRTVTDAAAALRRPPTLEHLDGSLMERSEVVRLTEREEIRQRLSVVRAELDSTLHHIWKRLLTHCKPDSMSARDALQRAVALFRVQEAKLSVSSGSTGGTGSVADLADAPSPHSSSQLRHAPGSSSSFGNGSGAKSSSTAFSVLPRDAGVEEALQRACDLFLTTEGAGSPITMRAYANMALYWYSVGCEAEWREWLQRLRRLWHEGGPEDVRQLLTAAFTVASYNLGGNYNSSGSVGGTSLRAGMWGSRSLDGPLLHPPDIAPGSGTPRVGDSASKGVGVGQSRSREETPIAFLQSVRTD